MKRRFILPLLLLILAGCATTQAPQWHQSTLYFGLSRQDGSSISPQQWQNFVDTEITSRFPDGFTVLQGNGQWRNTHGTVTQEASRVVIILHPASTDASQKIDQLRQRYKEQFMQQSVLQTTMPAAVAF